MTSPRLMSLKGRTAVENRSARAENEFVHEQVIADEKVVLHRGRRNLEGLNDERRSEQRQDDRNDERFEILPCCRFLESDFSHFSLAPQMVFLVQTLSRA